MENEGKLTHGQTAFLFFGGASGNIIYTFTWVTKVAGRPFWIATLIGVLLNIPFAVWMLYLGSYKQDATIFDILQEGFGRFVCGIIILLYLVINIASAVCMLNMFTGTVKIYFLLGTPSFIIMLLIVFLCALFVNSGIQTFAKLIEILVLFLMSNYFLGFGLSFTGLFNIKNIIPIFDTSVSGFSEGVLITAGSDMECLLFLMATVNLTPQTKKQYLSIAKGLFMWAVCLSFAIFIMEGDIGQEMLSRVAQAGITVSRIIQIGEFIRGLEILLLITYHFFAIVKITMFLYSSCVALKKLLNIKKGKLLIIPVALLIFIPSMLMDSFNSGYFLSLFLGSYVIFPFSLLVLLLASFSAKKIKRKAGK